MLSTKESYNYYKNNIKSIREPNYETSEVLLEYKNGETENITAHLSVCGQTFYISLDTGRLYLDDIEDGEWLIKMLL